MSKTLVIAVAGIAGLTGIALAVIIGGIVLDGATVGLISTIVGGISACVTAVSSRAQGPAQAQAPRSES